MLERESTGSVPTLCALAAAAFVAASVAHEAIGHGGVCLATGGQVRLLTSVYFRCAPGSAVVDAGGSLMNLAVALASVALLAKAALPPLSRVLLGFLAAYNGFWIAGYFLYSAFMNVGDWALVLRELSPRPTWPWRVGMAALGAGLYVFFMLVAARNLPRGRPLVIAYLLAGTVACSSALFYFGPVLPALLEAAKEGFLGPIGLALLALRTSSAEPLALPASGIAGAIGALVVVLFWFTLGRGWSGA
jgi:hypothetical protein